eukprot:scaffold82230_cov37-Tisochrysis_lutea.AAC.1
MGQRLPQGRKDLGRAGHRRVVAARVRKVTLSHGLYHRDTRRASILAGKGTNLRAHECCHVRCRSDGSGQVNDKSAHIRPTSTPNIEPKCPRRLIQVRHLQVVYRHLTRLDVLLRHLPRAGKFVEPLPVPAQCRVDGRPLQNGPSEPGGRFAQIGKGYVRGGRSAYDLAHNVLRVRLLAELGCSAVCLPPL